MKTKVKAFTLHEMVIVMVISVIIIGLAFTVLSMVKKHMWSIQQNFNLNTEFNRLEQALWIDTNRYGEMAFDDLENKLRFTSELDSTIYSFEENFILKDRDTFKIKIYQKTLFFKGEVTQKGKIDAIKLELHKKYKGQQLFIFKHNDAKQSIN